MEEIQIKIKELLDYSNNTKAGDGWDAVLNKINQQDVMIAELKALAKKNNTLLGREIKFQCADSYAYYVVLKIMKKNVVLAWIDYCDGWVDDRLGKMGSISIAFVKQQVDWENKMDRV